MNRSPRPYSYRSIFGCILAALAICAAAQQARGEDGSAGWLRYAPVTSGTACSQLPATVVAAVRDPNGQDAALVFNAARELSRGLTSMCGRAVTVSDTIPDAGALLVGTIGDVEDP